MVKYLLPHTRFNQISDHQHDRVYLNGKLSTKLLAQTANKKLSQSVRKLNGCLFKAGP